ncbi:hypothetical protein [Methylobacterium sp. J-092]|uniref:hypothetical protein n=1 Tax=Methylobacterium sp. J-092 TaxID=2836667 RepID=UPI001FBBD60F|nr:hypothetical protein [Methylobacterium sp. J-092]MCJ2009167.1 hypothetical protein [Methylobacterium sp. J-092]
MSNVLTFTLRPKVAAPVEPEPMAEAEIRTRLGEALQTALDAADHIIAVLDRMDGDTDMAMGSSYGTGCGLWNASCRWIDSWREVAALKGGH